MEFSTTNFVASLNENIRIRNIIEETLLQFLEEIFDKNAKKRKKFKLKNSNESENRKLPFIVTNPKPFAAHLQVLSQVHRMLLIGQKATKRDLFYENKNLYKDQTVFNRSLSAVCKLLGTSRRTLRVVGSSRGFATGSLLLSDNGVDDSVVDFRHNTVAVFEKLMEYRCVRSCATIVLIVEKDAIFQKLMDEKFTSQYPNTILVTGRGYPDICTREFLNWLSTKILARFLVLVDADPYGIEIFLTYKYGAKKESAEASHAKVPQVVFIGLRSTEATGLPITDSHYLPLLALDFKRLWSVTKRLEKCGEHDLLTEASNLLRTGHKLELEAISSITPNFLSSIYLKRKFEEVSY